MAGERRVGLLMGSFDPPHLGHLEICKYLLDRYQCSEIWVIPCFEHPFKKPLSPFGDRMSMCRLTFQEIGRDVIISDVEKRLGGTSYTVRTLEYLRNEYRGARFALIYGSDIKDETSQWKDFKRIEIMADLIEVPRGPDSPIPDISATDIRRRVKNGEGFKDLVPVSVGVYIVTHGLYHA